MGTHVPIGDNPNHVIHIQHGFRAVYSVDLIEGKKYHHMSLSCKKGYPGIPEAEVILELFGMGKSVHDLDNVYFEEELKTVNFLKELV